MAGEPLYVEMLSLSSELAHLFDRQIDSLTIAQFGRYIDVERQYAVPSIVIVDVFRQLLQLFDPRDPVPRCFDGLNSSRREEWKDGKFKQRELVIKLLREVDPFRLAFRALPSIAGVGVGARKSAQDR